MNKALKSKIILNYGCQENFCERMGESRSLVSNVIRGRRKLSFEKKILWAAILGCTVADIFPEPKQDKNPSTDLKNQ